MLWLLPSWLFRHGELTPEPNIEPILKSIRKSVDSIQAHQAAWERYSHTHNTAKTPRGKSNVEIALACASSALFRYGWTRTERAEEVNAWLDRADQWLALDAKMFHLERVAEFHKARRKIVQANRRQYRIVRGGLL